MPESEGSLAGEYTSFSSYNPDGSLAGESLPAAGDLFGEEVFHTYDDAGRPLTTYGGPEGSTVSYAARTDYTRYGEQQRLQLGTGTRRAWLSQYYDGPTRRVERTIVDAELPRPMLSDLHYRYDPAGNVTSIADTPADQPADTQCFRYDHLRRLTEAWTPAGDCATDPDAAELAGPAPYRQSLRYDQVGNRLSQVEDTAGGTVTRSYAYPDPGEDRPHALSTVTTAGPGAGTQTYQYDPAGNTTARGDQQLRWDEQGRLASVTDGAETTEYVHDPAGQRLLRRAPEATTLYLGGQEIRLDQRTGALTGARYYQHGGRTIAVRTSAGLSWLFTDHHGTGWVAVDSAALTATVRRHDPFGRPRGAEPASWPGERGFVGGTVDAGTGLTQLGAREYDPLQGRFISVDPLLNPSDPQQMNGYSYANNNPTTLSDPTGLIPDYCGVDVDCYGYHPHTGCPHGCGTSANQAWGQEQKAKRQKQQEDRNKEQAGKARERQARADAEAERRGQRLKDLVATLRDLDLSKLLEDPELARRIYRLLKQAAEDLNLDLPLESVSICGEGDAGAVFGATISVCANFDDVGFTVSGSLESGWYLGLGAHATARLRVNSVAADKLDIGHRSTLTRSVALGHGFSFEVGFEKTDPETASGSFSAFIEAGVGEGFNLGSYTSPIHNFNSDYIWKW